MYAIRSYYDDDHQQHVDEGNQIYLGLVMAATALEVHERTLRAAVAVQDLDQADCLFVITSYSIHYTKLYDRLLDWGLRLTLLLAAPAAVALAIIAVPLITTLFHHGAFTDNDVFMTVITSYSIHYTKLYEEATPP